MCVCVCGGGGTCTCTCITYVIHRYEGPRAVDVQCIGVLGVHVCSDTQI